MLLDKAAHSLDTWFEARKTVGNGGFGEGGRVEPGGCRRGGLGVGRARRLGARKEADPLGSLLPLPQQFLAAVLRTKTFCTSRSQLRRCLPKLDHDGPGLIVSNFRLPSGSRS